jgi:hypothetical protein
MLSSRTCLSFVLSLLIATSFSLNANAGPGDYSLRVKGGPSFQLKEWGNQVKVAGEFDYDFGYSMGFNLMTGFGISDEFRFQLIPSFRYDYLYIGPAVLYGLFGMGYSLFNSTNALDLRIGTGLNLPLGGSYEFITDLNLFISPAGVPATVVTLDWMMGFGVKFH